MPKEKVENEEVDGAWGDSPPPPVTLPPPPEAAALREELSRGKPAWSDASKLDVSKEEPLVKKDEAAPAAAPATEAKPEPPKAAPMMSLDEPAEDEADMTSIMDASARRALQQAARSGDATAVKHAAEQIAAQREGKTEAVTVPPPPEAAPTGEEKSTAPPPPEAGVMLPAKIPDAKVPRDAEPAPPAKPVKEEKPAAAAKPEAPAPLSAGSRSAAVGTAEPINLWLVAVVVAAILFVAVVVLAFTR